MTLKTNSRIAGFTFIFYIAAGISSLALSSRALDGEDITAKLANIAQHTTELRLVVLLSLLTCFSAIVLGVTLYALTREQDRDLAMLGLISRIAEGLSGMFVPRMLALLWLATSAGAKTLNTEAAQTLGAFLLQTGSWSASATFFAVGSTFFSWLLLRGRMVPRTLAWLGVIASLLLVVLLPLQYAGLFGADWFSTITWLLWLPMLVYEVWLALWLIIKGVTPSSLLNPAT